jgi:cell division protein FtsQ
VLAALALRDDQNVFDDGDAIAHRAETLGGVVSATVSRKLPGTLRVTVIEKIPVAFAPGPSRMVALDGDAKPLPYDPAATGLDLPVIPKVDSVLVRTLSVLRLTDSALFQDVDGARRSGRGGVTLTLGERRVLLPGVPAPDDVRALAAVRRHLASSGRRFTEIDARFEGWFVVRRSST